MLWKPWIRSRIRINVNSFWRPTLIRNPFRPGLRICIFYFNADQDPDAADHGHVSTTDPPQLHLEPQCLRCEGPRPSMAPLQGSKALEFFTLMRIRIFPNNKVPCGSVSGNLRIVMQSLVTRNLGPDYPYPSQFLNDGSFFFENPVYFNLGCNLLTNETYFACLDGRIHGARERSHLGCGDQTKSRAPRGRPYFSFPCSIPPFFLSPLRIRMQSF